MAQVKKLQQGGTLNINGKEYTADQINDYLSSGQFSAQERAALAGTVRAIQEGKSRYLDANSNSLSGDGNVNDDFADYFGSEWRANRGRSGWSNKKQNRHASRNSDFAIRDEALAKLGNIEKYLSSPVVKSSTTTKLGKGDGWFYTDGKYISGPQNLTNEKHIRNVFDYLASDEEGRKAWDVSGWGDSIVGLQNWYKGQDVNALLSRIKENTLTDEDKEVLAFMGYSPTESDITEENIATLRDKFQKAGYDFDKWSGIIDIDENGKAVVRVGEDGKTAFSSLGGNGNYFFNDQFIAANPNYSFLKDHFVIDGKVYKASDAGIEGSDLYNILRSSGGFYDLNKSGDWEGADKIIKHLWDGRTNYALGNSDVYSSFLAQNPNYRWTSITGAYDVPLAAGEQLIEYYDPNQNVNDFGYGQAMWAVLDQDGNFLRSVSSRGNATGKEASALTGRKIAKTTYGNSAYDGLVIEDLTDVDGESTGTTIFRDPTTGDMIYRGRIRGANIDEGKDYVIPSSISNILNRYPDFWSKLKADKQLQRQFERTLGDTINSGFRDMFTWNTMSKKNWMELGVSPEDADMLVKEFEKYASNSEKDQRSIRRANRLINQIAIQKNGGTVPMFQPGGAVGTVSSKGHTEKRLNTNYQNADDFASIGDGEWEGLTGADWAELGGLVADTVGLGLGLSGAPIASGVAGAVGSIAGFGADVSRDTNGDGRGFEWGDLGTLGINLGLDVVSLLPFGAGAVGQGAKAAKGIKTAGKTILKLFTHPKVVKGLAATGVISAATTSAKKIINGEEWTIRDVRNVLNGLSGALTLRKTGIAQGSGTKGKQVEQGTIDVKIKGSNDIETVTLKNDVLDVVNKPNTTDVDIKLKRAIAAELNAKGRKNNGRAITVDDIDLTPAKVKTKRTWRHPIKGEATDSYDFDIKTVTEPGELLATTGPEATRRGVVDQFNNWLKTGQFVEVRAPRKYRGISGEQARSLPKERVYVGQPQEYGDPFSWGLDYDVPGKQTDLTKRILASFRNSYKMPWKMAADQRALLRRASIFTPNLITRGEDIQHQTPTNFVPMPIIVNNKSLSELASMKKGGVIKAQGGLKFSDWSEETKQRFRDAKAAAEAAGKASFDFEGISYGLKKGADLPTETSTELPDILTKSIPSEDDARKSFMQAQGWPTEVSAPVIPETVDVTEEFVDEPTLAEDLAANGYSDKLIRKQQRWQNRAARDAARQAAGNPVGANSSGASNLSDFFRIGKMLNATSADAFQRKMARNVYDSTMRGMKSNIPEYYNRFQDYGIGEQYRQAANNLRKPIVNTHSDVNAMYANQLARNDQAIKMELEGGLKQSQLYSDWMDRQNELKRTYATKRTEIENENRLKAVNAENAYWTQMGASRAQMQNVIDNALTEQLGLYTQDRNMNYQLANQNETMRYSNDADNIRASYQQKLNNEISAGNIDSNTTLEEYFTANPTEYQNYINQMNALQTETLGRRLDNYRTYNQQSIFSAKKGGKVSSHKNSASEQIWINNQKINADAVKQLSKQAFEFLKMALS